MADLASVSPQRASEKCRNILIIEDDRDIRESLEMFLQMEGYHTIIAANGEEGLNALHGCERPCLILLDLMMPVMNGWEFLAAQRRAGFVVATIPVVVVSAAGEGAKSTGANGYIKKPIELETLLTFVKQYCG